MRPVALILGGEETLSPAVPGHVDATGAGTELAVLGGPVREELLIANLVAAPNEHVPAMRGRSPQLDDDLLAIDDIKWLGHGRPADRICDDATRSCDQGQGASRRGNFAAHRAPSCEYLGRSYSREANRGKRLIRARLDNCAGRPATGFVGARLRASWSRASLWSW